MPKIAYITKRLSPARKDMVDKANTIIAEYAAEGYELTLRQIYYQFVARGWLPNKQTEYKNLGDVLNDARMAGLVDWEAIVDRTRYLRKNSHWDSPAEIVATCAKQYQIDKWADQPNRIEVWIEKDALVGVIERFCEDNDVPYFSCRGYTSQSELWQAAMRLARHAKKGQTPVVLHFGDHDPSGIDMTRDITDRLSTFAGRAIKVERLALTMAQVEQYNPPPNPAKLTDSRCAGYMAEHGNESWELDALEPRVIGALIQNRINHYRNAAKWRAQVAKEKAERAQLQAVSDHWQEIQEQL